MSYRIATIQILVDTDSNAEACDAISETLRPLLREFAGDKSPIIDWRYEPAKSDWKDHDGNGFEYAEQEIEG